MDLNLLPSQAKFQMERVRLKKKINLAMMIGLGVWSIVVAIVLGYKLILGLNYGREKKKYDGLVASYSALSDKMVTSKKLKYQAKKVGEVLAARFEYAKTMRLANNFFSNEIVIKTFDLTEDKIFKIAGETRSEMGVDEVERKVEQINLGQVDNFSSARLGSIGVAGGLWNFAMEVGIK